MLKQILFLLGVCAFGLGQQTSVLDCQTPGLRTSVADFLPFNFTNQRTFLFVLDFKDPFDTSYTGIRVTLKNLDHMALAATIYLGPLGKCPSPQNYVARSTICSERREKAKETPWLYDTTTLQYTLKPDDFSANGEWFFTLVVEEGCQEFSHNAEVLLEIIKTEDRIVTCRSPQTLNDQTTACEMASHFPLVKQNIKAHECDPSLVRNITEEQRYWLRLAVFNETRPRVLGYAITLNFHPSIDTTDLKIAVRHHNPNGDAGLAGTVYMGVNGTCPRPFNYTDNNDEDTVLATSDLCDDRIDDWNGTRPGGYMEGFEIPIQKEDVLGGRYIFYVLVVLEEDCRPFRLLEEEEDAVLQTAGWLWFEVISRTSSLGFQCDYLRPSWDVTLAPILRKNISDCIALTQTDIEIEQASSSMVTQASLTILASSLMLLFLL